MLVQHQAVEAHLLGVDLLVEIAVVELGADPRVVAAIAQVEVLDVATGGAEVTGIGVLIGPLGEVPDEHVGAPYVRVRVRQRGVGAV